MFATDAILATLMTCTRSKYSWDIVVQVLITSTITKGAYSFYSVYLISYSLIKEMIHDLVSKLSIQVNSSFSYFNYCECSGFLTVDETAKEPPQDESGINSPQSLALEATYINQSLSQQMLVVSVTMTSMCVTSVVYM